MENGISNSSLPVIEQKSSLFGDPRSSSLFSGSSISFAGSSIPSDMQEESVDNIQMANDTVRMPDSSEMPFAMHTSMNDHIDNYKLQDYINGTSLGSISLLRLLHASLSSPDDPTSVSYPAAMTSAFNTSRPSGRSSTLESTQIEQGSSRYGIQDITLLDKKSYVDEKGDVRLDNDTAQYEHVFLEGKMDHVCQSNAMEMSEPGFLSAKNMVDPSRNHIRSKKLSFNLDYPELSVVNETNVPRHYSEFDLTDISGITPKNNTGSDDFGLLRSPLSSPHVQPTHSMLQRPVHFSPTLSGSRYLHAAQQILLEVARCAFKDSIEDNHQVISCTGNESSLSFSSGSSGITGSASCWNHVEEVLPFNSTSTYKLELLSLLRMMDGKYNNCVNQIQCVVGAFSVATESKTPRMHVLSPLHTVSILYRNLRDRITTAVLSSSQHINEHSSEKARSFESSFIQKQWALQQIKRNEVSWRPQRGLPERSVSVLRAWMFENFLHPYPKDSEKHLLAIKSGLTRSQVSNWFINARVRLWKPMIEEMYWEFNKKRRTEDDGRSQRTWKCQ